MAKDWLVEILLVVSSDADVWLLDLSVPCVIFLFSFHEFQDEKKIILAKDHPFVSFIALKIIYFFHCFFILNLIHLLLNVFEIFIMGMNPSTSRVCMCVNGQGLAGGDFVRLCPPLPMFGCWVYQFLVLCFCFHFMSFKGKKN